MTDCGMAIDTVCRSMLHSRVVGVALVLSVAGCVTSPTPVSMPPPDASTPPDVSPPPAVSAPPAPSAPLILTGKASWYGEPHHGQPTASGELYDMRQFTAAHRTLPLGTRVLVTNLRNGRTVEVRVNDRGPVAAGRIIDLSYAAAEELGAVSDGIFPVRVRVVSSPAR
jgi:rare lipoprotein A